MKKLALILLLLALVGCTHTMTPVCRHTAMFAAVTACETGPVVRTEIQKFRPPAVWLEPREAPEPPPLQDEMTVEDMVNWFNGYINALHEARELSELDKRMIAEFYELPDAVKDK